MARAPFSSCPENAEIPELEEGWNDLDDSLSVFVEDGCLMRGTRGNLAVYPYLPYAKGGYKNVVGISKDRINEVYWM